MADGSLTKHGFPRGVRFEPTKLELLTILSQYIGGALDPPFNSIFHNIRILDYHPEELNEMYKYDAEDRYIYFFSERQFQKAGAGVAVPEDKLLQKEPRPVRVAKGGGWKPSGGGQVLCLPRKKGGFVVGRMVTMVFYDRVAGGGAAKSNWGMHEFVVPMDQDMTSKPTKCTRFHNLALYRLYLLKGGDLERDNGAAGNNSSQMMPKGNDTYAPSTSVAPCPPLQSWGIFTGNEEALVAGVSTSHMLPPPQQLPSAQDAQMYYHNHQQHAFVGATAAGAGAQPHPHNMPVLGLPGNLSQFAVPQATANSAAAHQVPTAVMHGAGQHTGHFGAKWSPSATAEQHATATEEPAQVQFADCVRPIMEAAAPQPPLEDIASGVKDEGAMAVADDYEGIGKLDWDNFDFTATEEPAEVQFADCVRPIMEVAAPEPPLEDIAPGVKDEGAMAVADDNEGIGVPDWDNFDFTPLNDDSFQDLQFTIEELLGDSMLDESLEIKGGDDKKSGGKNQCSKSPAIAAAIAGFSCFRAPLLGECTFIAKI